MSMALGQTPTKGMVIAEKHTLDSSHSQILFTDGQG